MKPNVLIVDDDWAILELLKFTLTQAGFEVATAQDEESFEKMAFKIKPKVIILDIMLGEKDGTQIYQKLLMNGLDRNIPVIFLSALAQDRPPTPPRPGRTYALLGKPFDPDELVREVSSLITAA